MNDCSSGEIFRFGISVEIASATHQRGRREVDGTVEQFLVADKSRQNAPGFFPRAASQFGDDRRIPRESRKIGSVGIEQAEIGAGKSVFREQGYGFKQRAAKIVVKILWRQFFLPASCQAGTDITFELVRRN